MSAHMLVVESEPAIQDLIALNLERAGSRMRGLDFLMQHPERVHSRAHLLDQVWGRHVFLDERTVDAHAGRLRHALQPGGQCGRIETVRGSGYRFLAGAVRPEPARPGALR